MPLKSADPCGTAPDTLSSVEEVALPDEPGLLRTAAPAEEGPPRRVHVRPAPRPSSPPGWWVSLVPGGRPEAPVASQHDRLVEPGQTAPTLTARDKVTMGLEHTVSPFTIASWFVSAGFGHLMDGYPKYGVDRGAFGMRLGTGALRTSSEAILSDSVASPLFHEDPRYYRMGLGHNVGRRIGYAASRPLITRTDSGHLAINFALMAGNLAGSALTNAYYPTNSTGPGITFRTFGWSMEGAAIGDLVREFSGDLGDYLKARRERQAASP